ncbi:hypothetical protein VULLAG_LOCUS349 [Vulpes lagopus]
MWGRTQDLIGMDGRAYRACRPRDVPDGARCPQMTDQPPVALGVDTEEARRNPGAPELTTCARSFRPGPGTTGNDDPPCFALARGPAEGGDKCHRVKNRGTPWSPQCPLTLSCWECRGSQVRPGPSGTSRAVSEDWHRRERVTGSLPGVGTVLIETQQWATARGSGCRPRGSRRVQRVLEGVSWAGRPVGRARESRRPVSRAAERETPGVRRRGSMLVREGVCAGRGAAVRVQCCVCACVAVPGVRVWVGLGEAEGPPGERTEDSGPTGCGQVEEGGDGGRSPRRTGDWNVPLHVHFPFQAC